MVRTSWIYTLRKEELSKYLEEFHLESEGSVEEMRKRFTTFVSGEHKDPIMSRLEELEARHSRSSTPTPLEVPSVSHVPQRQTDQLLTSPAVAAAFLTPNHIPYVARDPLQRTPAPAPSTQFPRTNSQMSYAAAIDIVRKWSFRFDGGRDPLGFIERVEELAEVYELNTDMLPRTMPELLKDGALLWFRNNNKYWPCWGSFRDDFLAFFLPPRYFEELDDQIRRRQQKPRENFRSYLVEMQNMMRHAGYTQEQQIERIFRNSLVDYQLYIRRTDFKTLDQLIKMAEDYEILRANHPEVGREYRANHQAGPRREDRTRQVIPNDNLAPINPSTACRRCGEEGHGYRFCQNPSILFCWQCGRRGIRTRECCRGANSAGNATGPRQERGETSDRNNHALPH